MAPQFGVGTANCSLWRPGPVLGLPTAASGPASENPDGNSFFSVTDVRIILPWLGRQSLVCVTQELPRGGEVDCWRN
jgi:hypothetical protein